jgi:hypothetical protein
VRALMMFESIGTARTAPANFWTGA